MTTVEPIRSKSDIKKVEKVLASQSQRNLMLFVLGTNCGLMSAMLETKAIFRLLKRKQENLKNSRLMTV